MRHQILPPIAIDLALAAVILLSSCQTPPTKRQVPVKEEETEPQSPAAKLYKNKIEDHLGPIWYRLVKANQDQLSLGTVTIRFDIPAAGGKVRNFRVISNTGGRMDELVALRAIDQLRAPPVPPPVLAGLQSDHLEFEESFTIFASR